MKLRKMKALAEQIEGLIMVYKDGYLERPPIMPNVPCSTFNERGVTAKDIMMIIHADANLWARVYVPTAGSAGCRHGKLKLPLLVYFHGGGFCVGSAAWRCYHDFLTNLASKANCVTLSVNYHLAPEHRLPSAYDDGFNALMWVMQEARNNQASPGLQQWWLSQCNLSRLFLGGDSAGANIAFHVMTRLSNLPSPSLTGMILIQPFFGGESRTESEKHLNHQSPHSALTLSASDTYWRLSLPVGASRDHPYCNPLAYGMTTMREMRMPPTMVCISEMDILKDRNLGFCDFLIRAGKRVETVTYGSVGHAFQILQNSSHAQNRTQEMISHIKTFISK